MTRTFRYGSHDSQLGELHLPLAGTPSVVCLFHGGFWRIPYGREQMNAIACDLMACGHAVWNVGYRRVGETGGGWPGTLEDAITALDHLEVLSRQVAPLDLRRVAIAGHSAGGQLALHAAVASRGRSVRPVAVASLAGVLDLQQAHEIDSGGGAVSALLGGTPESVPERYRDALPLARLPAGVRQLVLHGARDEALPASMARNYARLAQSAGDPVVHVELPDTGHMEYLDPHSAAHATLREWLGTALRAS